MTVPHEDITYFKRRGETFYNIFKLISFRIIMAKFNLIYVWRTLRIDPLGNLLFMNNLSGLRNSHKLAMGYF